MRDEIAAYEAHLRAAMMVSDVDALDALLADDLATHRSGLLKLAELTPRDPRIRAAGDAAIVTLSAILSGTYAGQPFTGDFV